MYDDGSNTVFCPLDSVAGKSFNTLFQRVVRSSAVSIMEIKYAVT